MSTLLPSPRELSNSDQLVDAAIQALADDAGRLVEAMTTRNGSRLDALHQRLGSQALADGRTQETLQSDELIAQARADLTRGLLVLRQALFATAGAVR